MDWTALNAVASIVSAVAFLGGTLVVAMQLLHMAKDRFVAATGSLFEICTCPRRSRWRAIAVSQAAIPGSLRVAPQEIPERFSEIPRDRLAVGYCT